MLQKNWYRLCNIFFTLSLVCLICQQYILVPPQEDWRGLTKTLLFMNAHLFSVICCNFHITAVVGCHSDDNWCSLVVVQWILRFSYYLFPWMTCWWLWLLDPVWPIPSLSCSHRHLSIHSYLHLSIHQYIYKLSHQLACGNEFRLQWWCCQMNFNGSMLLDS
jgi:hypothetical protein